MYQPLCQSQNELPATSDSGCLSETRPGPSCALSCRALATASCSLPSFSADRNSLAKHLCRIDQTSFIMRTCIRAHDDPLTRNGVAKTAENESSNLLNVSLVSCTCFQSSPGRRQHSMGSKQPIFRCASWGANTHTTFVENAKPCSCLQQTLLRKSCTECRITGASTPNSGRLANVGWFPSLSLGLL